MRYRDCAACRAAEPLSYRDVQALASDIQDTKAIWAKLQRAVDGDIDSLADALRRADMPADQASLVHVLRSADRTAQLAVGGSAACLSALCSWLQVRAQSAETLLTHSHRHPRLCRRNLAPGTDPELDGAAVRGSRDQC